ncbi:YjgF family translation initiation inhibitor [Paraburkholderia silviterrae]|uniref:YjgF family translation initiation inhibitor n=1 Tax=Paraburkholderia silviterrae TaxID=2528715 RepID=A0A4R5M9W0_9BURK|nr:YjgF family translation initiation inhibitor [Paraburkholderia silviterrae]
MEATVNHRTESASSLQASWLPSARLAALNIVLPRPAAPVGEYEPWARYANLITTSFQLPFENGSLPYIGQLGRNVTAEEGMAAARLCALNGLARLAEAAGSIDNIRLIRLDGHIGCAPTFGDMPAVLDAASRLIHDILGERGRHARTSLGHHVMPRDVPVMLGFFAEVVDANWKPA